MSTMLLLKRSVRQNRAVALASSRAASNRTAVVGVVRETYGNWERRAPLVPDHVRQLTEKGFKVVVQPSSRRIFTDNEYKAAGAELNDDLSQASVVLGVKQVPVQNLLNDKAYMFFSHTIKGQEENMELLDACVDKNITLFDYECIVDPKSGKRLVAFGQFAGIVGMVDMLQGLGQRLLADGYSTPFLLSSLCYMKPSLAEVEKMVLDVGERIKAGGLPSALDPIVFTFTGHGNVGQGAKRMFELLPVTMVEPEDLPALMEREKGKPQTTVYGCYLEHEHLAQRKDGKAFDKNDYYNNPSQYEGTFHSKIAPHTTVLVNGMYWDARFPRLLTTDQMKALSANGRPKLRAIADITCDLGGSLEFCENSTLFEQPYYEYDGQANQVLNVGGSERGVAIDGVDILPTALPRDASQHFGDHLMPILSQLLEAQKLGSQTTALLTPAMITHNRKLQKAYQYIQTYRDERKRLVEAGSSRLLKDRPRRVVLVQGHLFDSKFINTAIDMAEKKGDFEIMDFMVVANTASGPRESQVVLGLSGDDEETLESMVKDVIKLGELLDCRVQELEKDVHLHVDVPKALARPARKVLLLGSGMVAAPVVDYLTRKPDNKHITIVSDSKQTAQALAARAVDSATAVELAVEPRDATEAWSTQLDELIAGSDVVISLLPPPFHASIARRCIRNKTHLVTASYVSPEMATLHDEAKAAGVIILNEMGLDPGIDHMSAMKLIEEAQSAGAAVKKFSSVCGGLSSPDALAPDNPLQYTFSWSPAGVCSAALTPAKYLRDGKLIEMDGYQKLAQAEPFYGWPSLNLEVSANRDSVSFGDIYGISHTADTVFRGTLRFEGWCRLMYGFTQLGLLDASHEIKPGQSWEDMMSALAKARGFDSPLELLRQTMDEEESDRVLAALNWLGASGSLPSGATNATTAFVSILSEKLSLKPGERDLILMRHDLVFEYPNGETHTTYSSMMAFGDDNATAMAKTVGLTAAIGANLVLEGHLDEHTGLASPMLKEVFIPALERLELEGVKFLEKTVITK